MIIFYSMIGIIHYRISLSTSESTSDCSFDAEKMISQRGILHLGGKIYEIQKG